MKNDIYVTIFIDQRTFYTSTLREPILVSSCTGPFLNDPEYVDRVCANCLIPGSSDRA